MLSPDYVFYLGVFVGFAGSVSVFGLVGLWAILVG